MRGAEDNYRKHSALFNGPFFWKRGGCEERLSFRPLLHGPVHVVVQFRWWTRRGKVGGRGAPTGRRIAE